MESMYITAKMIDGLEKSDRSDQMEQKSFVEELSKEDNLDRFSRRQTEEIFYFLFYINTVSVNEEVKKTAEECLRKFFS